MEVLPFNQEAFDKAKLEENEGAIEGMDQEIHWTQCDRAFQRKTVGGVWFGMPKEGGCVKVTAGYSVYFIRGTHGEVRSSS
ncbi:hypothetical protein B0J13DRAFT_558366 [Dactylonectria estremocensis]|uniref:Uncharacterized protein n=1 Tax=Dactylonectria estremocensis TaxID=1079267 RepID=A0A9P9J1C4_9HYPO|nr:hypothetical protein B0J13DRAFT_558366 [Dactylonectria estremocensis]